MRDAGVDAGEHVGDGSKAGAHLRIHRLDADSQAPDVLVDDVELGSHLRPKGGDVRAQLVFRSVELGVELAEQAQRQTRDVFLIGHDAPRA